MDYLSIFTVFGTKPEKLQMLINPFKNRANKLMTG
jgi:hypothetical protein